MPRDADLGRQLASNINDNYTGRIKQISFSYDPFAEADKISEIPSAWISPFGFEHVRETRNEWRQDITLLITMMVKQAPNVNMGFYDVWLDSWDALLGVVKASGFVSAIEQEERYQLDQQQTYARLICQARVIMTYQ